MQRAKAESFLFGGKHFDFGVLALLEALVGAPVHQLAARTAGKENKVDRDLHQMVEGLAARTSDAFRWFAPEFPDQITKGL